MFKVVWGLGFRVLGLRVMLRPKLKNLNPRVCGGQLSGMRFGGLVELLAYGVYEQRFPPSTVELGSRHIQGVEGV